MILIKYSSQFFPWIVTYSVPHFACLSRRMQDVAGVNSVRCGVFMCSCFSCSSRKVTKSATDITSKDGQNRILACKFSPSWRYFAACDDAKRLYLFQCGERWELVSNRYVEFSEVRWQGKNCWLAVNTSSADSIEAGSLTESLRKPCIPEIGLIKHSQHTGTSLLFCVLGLMGVLSLFGVKIGEVCLSLYVFTQPQTSFSLAEIKYLWVVGKCWR